MSGKVKKPQKVEIKEKKLGETLSIVLPLAGIFVFLVGGLLLFLHMEEGRWIPDEHYLAAENLINGGTLIGLTFEECAAKINSTWNHTEGDEWAFLIVGHKWHTNGVGDKSFSIYVQHENGVAVSAVMEETR
jgi:hypothetical protein